jgi:aminoglycoside 6'-N-acetyltransferase I
VQIVTLQQDQTDLIDQAARVLHAAFRNWPQAWPTYADALQEIHDMLLPGRIALVAQESGGVVGFVAGIPSYRGNVWELHALAVRPDRQKRGIGAALVRGLELAVKERGGITITLGTDDEDDTTTLGGADLYTNLWDQVRAIRNLKGHPYTFYQKQGFTITGVLPDANGPGKPDIFMSKRVV